MSKQSQKKPVVTLLNPLPEKRFCPECHREISYIVESIGFNYFVHRINDVCAVDNRIVKNG